MKRLNFKSVFFALVFAVVTGFIAVSAAADGFIPAKNNQVSVYDTNDDGAGDDDTTDGGIRFPGTGH